MVVVVNKEPARFGGLRELGVGAGGFFGLLTFPLPPRPRHERPENDYHLLCIPGNLRLDRFHTPTTYSISHTSDRHDCNLRKSISSRCRLHISHPNYPMSSLSPSLQPPSRPRRFLYSIYIAPPIPLSHYIHNNNNAELSTDVHSHSRLE